MKLDRIARTAALLVVFSASLQAAPLVVDSFETADMSAPNTSGFRWASNNRTSIVTMNNGPYSVYHNGVISKPGAAGTDWTAYDGKYSLRFRYPVGEFMSEQRFSLGKHYPDLWISYWIRVPTNFTHGRLNNKWMALWTDVYDGPGDVTWQTRPNSSGGANLVVQDGGVASPETLSAPFISVPGDRGRWMQIVARAKPASAAGANNGILQFYRRWAGESAFTKIHEKLNAKFYQGGQGIYQGYLMGWANDAYKVDTEWLLDRFTVSTESLLDSAAPSSPAASPPSAPVLQARQL